ncbi:NAD-dependent epimerase/dehydratase family protein [Chitinophaga horti]|uniref:NAD-dependent epimerase/dehydratase family protein n=1 Tax=Chitinophaga horti TaxID=2920382 RepID=A0ABY6IWF2_9BACT|nr:NAD-dependent epimerase/dehydratase family protein [Chitinophaga horti]UYQ91615.1 NAD-dependent epimerase/dehydratase family protein [Chitinophaga horti]
MQTILGANGIIGRELSKALQPYASVIRQVSRNPKKVNDTDQVLAADLTDYQQTVKAVEGSAITYLTAGLPYNHKVWQKQWPLIVQNTINACKIAGSKLVFFDNVYMYGHVKGWMTEDTPYRPSSKKGKVRTMIAQMLHDEMHRGALPVLIARSADFYGPGADNSVPNILVLNNLVKGGKPQWMGKSTVPHSFTYTPDAGRATALLGNTPSAYNQVWHLPTDKNALTGKEFIRIACELYGKQDAKFSIIPDWMLRVGGIFKKELAELIEMNYQYEYDYLFDSSKFEKAFHLKPTPYRTGLQETINALKKK